jgi:hypothetical protein
MEIIEENCEMIWKIWDTIQRTFLSHFFYTNEKALCKTIQLKLVNTDLSLTQNLHVTIGLQNILEGCRRAAQLNMSMLLVGTTGKNKMR